MIKKIFITLLFSLFLIENSYSKESFFDEAKKLFDKEKYEESKFLFQRDIVFNPKKAGSYLYLAKIFKVEELKKNFEKVCSTLCTKISSINEKLKNFETKDES